MRWNGQTIGASDGNALPGMEHLGGFVRSVTTPEFAGMTFHEVVAKSALNHVPGASGMPFDWTVNPYRGCSHACSYCLAPETRILLADGRTRALRDLRIGDAIIGTERRGNYRRYVATTVRTGAPVRASSTWCSPSPHERRLVADAHSAASLTSHTPMTREGS